MRVLVVIAEAEASRYWTAVLPLLRSRGVEVALATLSQRGPLHDALAPLGIPAYALGTQSRLGCLRMRGRLGSLVADLQPDIVHAHETLPGLASGTAIRGDRPVRLYHRHHGVPTPRHRAVAALVTRLSSCTVSVSHDAALSSSRYERGDPSRSLVAHNGAADLRHVAAPETAALRQALGIPATASVVVLVARMRHEKGHDVWLDSLQRWSRRNVHTVLVGRGPMEGRLREHAASLRAPVHFVGHQDDVAPWFSLADAVVMPSRQEPFGLVAVEALAARRPLVASGVGGLREIVTHDETGLLVEPEDPGALAASVSRVLDDPPLAARLAAAGRAEYERRFTMEMMAARWIGVYRAAMSQEHQ